MIWRNTININTKIKSTVDPIYVGLLIVLTNIGANYGGLPSLPTIAS